MNTVHQINKNSKLISPIKSPLLFWCAASHKVLSHFCLFPRANQKLILHYDTICYKFILVEVNNMKMSSKAFVGGFISLDMSQSTGLKISCLHVSKSSKLSMFPCRSLWLFNMTGEKKWKHMSFLTTSGNYQLTFDLYGKGSTYLMAVFIYL